MHQHPRHVLRAAADSWWRRLSPTEARAQTTEVGADPDAMREAEARVAAWDARCREDGVRFVCPSCPEWPAALADLSSPPPWLYVRGRSLPTGPALAVVGSRTVDHYALRMAAAIATRWARAAPGAAIVSGSGLGVDAAALEAALAADAPVVSVLAGCPARPTPRRLGGLFEAVVAAGAVVSETGPGLRPYPPWFPDRNRLIAALATHVVVVRGAPGSGSLSTLHAGRRLGRTVLVVPGLLDDPLSAGVHAAAARGWAAPLWSLDAIDRLALGDGATACTPTRAAAAEGGADDPTERQVLDALGGAGARVGEVAAAVGLTVTRLMPIMLALELAGRVRRLPGARFARVAPRPSRRPPAPSPDPKGTCPS